MKILEHELTFVDGSTIERNLLDIWDVKLRYSSFIKSLDPDGVIAVHYNHASRSTTIIFTDQLYLNLFILKYL